MEADRWVGRSPTSRPVGFVGLLRDFNGRRLTLKVWAWNSCPYFLQLYTKLGVQTNEGQYTNTHGKRRKRWYNISAPDIFPGIEVSVLCKNVHLYLNRYNRWSHRSCR